MSTKSKESCPAMGCSDAVTRTLGKVGVCRSMLITLALLPYSWNGVVWIADALHSLWNAATNAVGT